jgi:hypothetical protein
MESPSGRSYAVSVELEEGVPCLIRIASKGVCADAWRIIQSGRRRKLPRNGKVCDDIATLAQEPAWPLPSTP